MDLQKKLAAALQKTGIPSKSIECYGNQIIITSRSQKTAEKWAAVLSKFCKSVKTITTNDYAKINKGTTMNPTCIKVVRTFGTI